MTYYTTQVVYAVVYDEVYSNSILYSVYYGHIL